MAYRFDPRLPLGARLCLKAVLPNLGVSNCPTHSGLLIVGRKYLLHVGNRGVDPDLLVWDWAHDRCGRFIASGRTIDKVSCNRPAYISTQASAFP